MKPIPLVMNGRFFTFSLVFVGLGLILGVKIVNVVFISFMILFSIFYWKKIIGGEK